MEIAIYLSYLFIFLEQASNRNAHLSLDIVSPSVTFGSGPSKLTTLADPFECMRMFSGKV